VLIFIIATIGTPNLPLVGELRSWQAMMMIVACWAGSSRCCCC